MAKKWECYSHPTLKIFKNVILETEISLAQKLCDLEISLYYIIFAVTT